MSATEAVVCQANRGFAGLIHGATLGDLVQMECLGMTTRAVRIDRAELSGRIFFARGQVVHAEVGDLRGEAACFELLGWPDGNFAIEQGVRPYEQTISRQWQSILIAAAHHHDESNENKPANEINTPPMMSTLNDTAVRGIFGDPDIQSAAFFSEAGAFFDGKGAESEDLQATFSYIVQLARLIGESLGAESLHEIQIAAPEYRALCVTRELDTVAVITSPKANIPTLAKKISDALC